MVVSSPPHGKESEQVNRRQNSLTVHKACIGDWQGPFRAPCKTQAPLVKGSRLIYLVPRKGARPRPKTSKSLAQAAGVEPRECTGAANRVRARLWLRRPAWSSRG